MHIFKIQLKPDWVLIEKLGPRVRIHAASVLAINACSHQETISLHRGVLSSTKAAEVYRYSKE